MHVTTRRVALLLALGLASTGIGLAASPVSAAGNGCTDATQSCVVVTVVSTVGFKVTRSKPYEYSAAAILATSDLTGPKYTTRKAGGDATESPTPPKALRLIALVNDIATNNASEQATLVGNITFSEVTYATDAPRVLDKPAFGGQSGTVFPYYENTSPSIYALPTGEVGYFRPMTDKDDVNAPDLLTVTGRFDLTIHTTGKLLAPKISVSDTSPTTKEKPRFSVSGKPDPRLRFRWDFGDNRGPGRTSQSTGHRYTKKGTYGAFVTVRGADGSYGRSAVVTVKVAKPPKPPKPTKTPSTGSGGGTTGGYVPPYNPPTTNLPEPDPVQDPPVEEPTPDVPVDDGLTPVEGYVLAGSEIVPGGTPEAIPGTQASNAPTPASKTSTRKQIATWIVAALGFALLIGAGAASETRWFRNRLHHLRRRA